MTFHVIHVDSININRNPSELRNSLKIQGDPFGDPMNLKTSSALGNGRLHVLDTQEPDEKNTLDTWVIRGCSSMAHQQRSDGDSLESKVVHPNQIPLKKNLPFLKKGQKWTVSQLYSCTSSKASPSASVSWRFFVMQRHSESDMIPMTRWVMEEVTYIACLYLHLLSLKVNIFNRIDLEL